MMPPARSGMIEKGTEVTVFDYQNSQLIVEEHFEKQI